MHSRQQPSHHRGADREQIARARQAAEALFTPRPPVSEPSAPGTPPAGQSARKPRVLRITSPAAPVRHDQPEARAAPQPQITREIPRSQFARVQALAKYGMTVAQVAEVYGVTIGEIERILRQA